MEATYAPVKAETLHRHMDMWSTPSFITKKEHILSKIPSFLGVIIFLCVIMLIYLTCWDIIYPKCNNVGTTLKTEGWVTYGVFSFVHKAVLIWWWRQTPPTAQQMRGSVNAYVSTTLWVKGLPALTRDAHCEIISTGHLANGFSLKLLNVLWLPVGSSVSMAQLPVQLGATLHILQDRNTCEVTFPLPEMASRVNSTSSKEQKTARGKRKCSVCSREEMAIPVYTAGNNLSGSDALTRSDPASGQQLVRNPCSFLICQATEPAPCCRPEIHPSAFWTIFLNPNGCKEMHNLKQMSLKWPNIAIVQEKQNK